VYAILVRLVFGKGAYYSFLKEIWVSVFILAGIAALTDSQPLLGVVLILGGLGLAAFFMRNLVPLTSSTRPAPLARPLWLEETKEASTAPAVPVKAQDALPIPKSDPRTALVSFQDMLVRDQASALVGLGLEHQPSLLSAAQYILTRATPIQRNHFQATIDRAHLLGIELTHLIETDPVLVLGYTGQTEEAVRSFAKMLTCLITNHVGAFARLGAEKELPWAILPDRLERLKALSPSERQQMAGCCAYIRQTAMFSTGMEELLAAQP
jgi:hypothetical protein